MESVSQSKGRVDISECSPWATKSATLSTERNPRGMFSGSPHSSSSKFVFLSSDKGSFSFWLRSVGGCEDELR